MKDRVDSGVDFTPSEEDDKRPSFFIGDQEGRPLKVVGANEEEIDEVVVAPDGGYGWVIVIASFLSNLVVDGTIFSFGILLNPIHEDSGKSIPLSTIAWVGSLATGFYFLAGPIVSAVANRFGFRVASFAGSLLASVAIFLAWLVCRTEPVMWALFLLYGVIGGIAFGFVYTPAVIAVGFYFSNKRALATGISICGSGVGTFLFPPIMNYLIENYRWQGALLFQSAVMLTCVVFALLYKPLAPTKVMSASQLRRPSGVSSIQSQEGTPLMLRIKKAREMDKSVSIGSCLDGTQGEGDSQLKPERPVMVVGPERHRKTSAPTTLVDYEGLKQKRLSVPSMLGTPELTITPPIKGKSFVGLPGLKEEEEREGTPPISPDTEKKDEINDVDGNENTALVRKRNSTFVVARIGSSMLMIDEMTQSRTLKVSASKISLTKPMYRSDIFYTGSVIRLPEYNDLNKVMSSAELGLAVTSIPLGDADEEETHPCCSPAVLRKMLDVGLLASPTFLLLAISGFFTMLGLFVPFIYLKGVATESVGVNSELATMLVSVIGICNTVGRIFSGWLADRPEINVLFLNNLSVTIIGLATAAVPFLHSFNMLIGFSCVFGLAMACFASLRSILLVELLGLENLTNAFGLSLVFQGVATILGTPLAGFLYEATGTYSIPFFIAGGFVVFSGVLCYPLNCVKRWEDSRNRRRDNKP